MDQFVDTVCVIKFCNDMHVRLIFVFLPKATYRTFWLPEPSLHLIPANAMGSNASPFIVAVATMASLLTSTAFVVKSPTVELLAVIVVSTGSITTLSWSSNGFEKNNNNSPDSLADAVTVQVKVTSSPGHTGEGDV